MRFCQVSSQILSHPLASPLQMPLATQHIDGNEFNGPISERFDPISLSGLAEGPQEQTLCVVLSWRGDQLR